MRSPTATNGVAIGSARQAAGDGGAVASERGSHPQARASAAGALKVDPHRDLLTRAASALWGPRWKTQAARVLKVDPRLVRRWAAGHRPIPGWVVDRLGELVHTRLSELLKLVPLLTEARTGAKDQGGPKR